MDKQVTKLEAMRKQVHGEVVTIPGWIEGEPIDVRVRRVDLTALILAAGPLPNPLATAAKEAFEGKSSSADTPNPPTMNDIQQMNPVLEEVARQALVDPTYKQMVEQVAPLTMEQKFAIFDHAVGHLKSLQPFRRQPGSNDSDPGGGKDLGDKAEQSSVGPEGIGRIHVR